MPAATDSRREGRSKGGLRWLTLAGLSWRELARRTWRESRSDNVLNRAAELAFWFVLGFFPMLLFATSVGTSIAMGPGASGALMKYLSSVLPSDASGLVRQVLEQTAAAGKAWVSLLIALWSSSSATAGLIDTLNVMYDLKESRPWWKARLIALALAFAMGVLITLALIIVTNGSAILDHFAPHSAAVSVWNIVQWPAAGILLVLALLGVYRFAPNVKEQKWKWLLPGSIVAAAIWLLVSFVFRLYVRHVSNFGVMYGSVGALIILMFWFYLSGVSILVGGEMNAILEDSAAKRKVPGAKRRGQHSPSQEPE